MVKIVANDAEFDEIMKGAGDKAIIVDFTASWCGPCQFIGPKFAELAEQNSGSDKVIFLKVDVDECEETAAKCGIQAMPTFKVFKNNSTDAVEEMVGANEAKLRELVAKYAQ